MSHPHRKPRGIGAARISPLTLRGAAYELLALVANALRRLLNRRRERDREALRRARERGAS